MGILLSLVFSVAGFISRSIRWNLLIEPLGHKPKVSNSFYAVMTGYLANFALPRLGEITRCATLSKSEKIPVDALIGTVIAERVIDVITLVILLFVVFIAKIKFFGQFFIDKLFIPLFGKVHASLQISVFYYIFAGVFVLGIIILYFVFRRKINEIFIVRKTKKLIRGIYAGLSTIIHMQKRWQFLLHTLFIWTMYTMMTYVVVFAIPATSGLSLIDGLFLLVIGGIGMSAPVQNGFGAFHGIISLGLTLYGIPREQGLVYATIAHESQAILIFLLAGYSLLMLFLNRRRKIV
ncbi:MAG: lysylphosphatidylglycerol synthase transmembrane domain-containing protein [Bacteroidia bacterium]|nr:lysylphosphatidylglycerol synthase transmembrane domain-containing protein [Bacteroidia bacterium]